MREAPRLGGESVTDGFQAGTLELKETFLLRLAPTHLLTTV
jgi:hypothetical protein